MKRIAKLLIPILIFAALFAILCLPSSAASEMTYAVYNSEQDYLTNPDSPSYKGTTGNLISTGISSRSYVVFHSDLKLNEGIIIQNGSDVTIDLNGHKLSAASSITIGANAAYTPTKLTIKNGTIVHLSAQFFKPQPNSRVFLENVTLHAQGSSGNIVYGDSFRAIHFIDSEIILSSNLSTFFSIFPPLDYQYAGIKSAEGNTDKVYTQNIIFENSRFIDNRKDPTGHFITYNNRANSEGYLDITFLDGSGFTPLGSSFLKNNNEQPTCYIHLNVEKGASFAEPTIPVDLFNIDPKIEFAIYNDIEYDYGSHVFREPTELLGEGEVQPDGEIKKLIWGYSGNDSYPYRLCHYLCDVTWIDRGVVTEVKGYSDGLKLKNTLTSTKQYYVENNGVYYDSHVGWSTLEDGSDCSEYAHIVDTQSTFYSVFEKVGPAAIVEYADSEMSVSSIISTKLSASITPAELSRISSNSYVLLYDNVELVASDVATLEWGFTLDLGGKALSVRDNPTGKAAIDLISAELKIKNGELRLDRESLVLLEGGASLVLDGIDVYYDIAPIAEVASGSVTVTDSTLTQLSFDTGVPAFILGSSSTADLTVERSSLTSMGTLATTMPTGSAATVNVLLKDCSELKANSLFALYPASADIHSPSTDVTVTVDNCFVDTAISMDIPVTSSGVAPVTAKLVVVDGKFTSDPAKAPQATVVLPEGKVMVKLADGLYTLVDSSLAIKFSYELMGDMAAKIYVPTASGLSSLVYLSETVPVAELAKVAVDGEEHYLFVIDGISPSDALDAVRIDFNYTDSDGKASVLSVNYEPIQYFEELLSSPDTLVRKLAASVLRYVSAAYGYTGSTAPAELLELLASREYLNAIRSLEDIPERQTAAEKGNISLAFSTAQLYLSDTVSVRLNLKDSFSGSLSILDRTYTVEQGIADGKDHILVTLTPYELYRKSLEISGTSADGTAVAGEYSLSEYIAAAAGNDAMLDAMLASLFGYCYEAFVSSNGGVLPPYIEHTPAVDVDHRVPQN